MAGAILVSVLLVVLVYGVSTASSHRPQLIVDDSVAADFRALALELWGDFLHVFQAKGDCFGDVYLRAARILDSRAAYDPENAVVTVRVPGTPAMLQGGLIHEWAHHVEFQCAEHQELRPAFLAAQALPPDTAWRRDEALAGLPAGAWAGMPSEQWAEAVVELVLSGRQIPTKASVTREAMRVVEEWATGE